MPVIRVIRSNSCFFLQRKGPLLKEPAVLTYEKHLSEMLVRKLITSPIVQPLVPPLL
jgi:hypothetical protein